MARPSATRWRWPPESFLHALRDLGAAEATHLQAERHVVVDAHMRIERVVLKHHGDVAIHGRQMIDQSFADQDLAGSDGFESGDHPQRRRLAAPGRPYENHELAVADLEVHVLDRVDLVELLVEVTDDDL
jgi:hypothetical protein